MALGIPWQDKHVSGRAYAPQLYGAALPLSALQRFRFTTSLLYTVCVSCEFLTPRFPSHFLLLTAISNVGRAVGLTTFVSTQPAFQAALCASGNMADLASKTQVGGGHAYLVTWWCKLQ